MGRAHAVAPLARSPPALIGHGDATPRIKRQVDRLFPFCIMPLRTAPRPAPAPRRKSLLHKYLDRVKFRRLQARIQHPLCSYSSRHNPQGASHGTRTHPTRHPAQNQAGPAYPAFLRRHVLITQEGSMAVPAARGASKGEVVSRQVVKWFIRRSGRAHLSLDHLTTYTSRGQL